MTEQEKREKAIREMAEVICPTFEIQCYDCHRDCNVEEDSERLYDAGYRKEEEVLNDYMNEQKNIVLNMKFCLAWR